MHRPTILVAASAAFSTVLWAPSSLAQVDADPGFRVADALDVGPDSGFGIAYGSLTDGSFVRCDGASIDHFAADGSLIQHLGDINPGVFPSFVEIDPTMSFALVGESSFGTLIRADIANGGLSTITTINFNFDLAWDVDPDFVYVSAGLGGFGAGNDVVRVDLTAGTWTPVIHVDGPSGPIAVLPSGDLYYVTQYEGPDFPPPLGGEHLIRFDDAALDSGNVLDETDAEFLTAALDGGSSLAYDSHGDRLFLAHTNFAGAPNEILAIAPDGELIGRVGESLVYLSNVEVFAAGGAPTFSAFQPENARLVVQNTDFATSLRERVTLNPERARALFAGPPAGQVGQATVTIEGAQPGGLVSVLFARSADELPFELANDFGWGPPTFTGVDVDRVLRRTQQMPVDAAGNASFTYTQSPSQEGGFFFQAILYDASERPLGTSTHVIN